jgi:hypothetical protein
VHDGTEKVGLSKVSWEGEHFFQFSEEVVGLQTMYLKLAKNTLTEDVKHRGQPIIFHEYLTRFFPLAILGLDSALVMDFSILQRTGMPFVSQFTASLNFFRSELLVLHPTNLFASRTSSTGT